MQQQLKYPHEALLRLVYTAVPPALEVEATVHFELFMLFLVNFDFLLLFLADFQLLQANYPYQQYATVSLVRALRRCAQAFVKLFPEIQPPGFSTF